MPRLLPYILLVLAGNILCLVLTLLMVSRSAWHHQDALTSVVLLLYALAALLTPQIITALVFLSTERKRTMGKALLIVTGMLIFAILIFLQYL